MSPIQYRLSNVLRSEDVEIIGYHTRRVPDPPDPRPHDIYYAPRKESSCQVSLASGTTSVAGNCKTSAYFPAESETALALSLVSETLYKVKILVGGQNICSYERVEESEGQIQDYFIMLGQLSIDGVFVRQNLLRQLVAVESDKPGYSIEHQKTGEDKHLNIQLQFFHKKRRLTNEFYIVICTLTGLFFEIDELDNDTTIGDIKSRIYEKLKIPKDQQRLIFRGRQLEDEKRVVDYAIKQGRIVHMRLRLRGGGGRRADTAPCATPASIIIEPPTTIAPGGYIAGELLKDLDPEKWCEKPAHTVNLKVLNYEKFKSTTGLTPETPSPDEVAKISVERCRAKQLRPLTEEERKLRGIGEVHEETGINIRGPYDANRPGDDDAEIHQPLTWRRILFCGC